MLDHSQAGGARRRGSRRQPAPSRVADRLPGAGGGRQCGRRRGDGGPRHRRRGAVDERTGRRRDHGRLHRGGAPDLGGGVRHARLARDRPGGVSARGRRGRGPLRVAGRGREPERARAALDRGAGLRRRPRRRARTLRDAALERCDCTGGRARRAGNDRRLVRDAEDCERGGFSRPVPRDRPGVPPRRPCPGPGLHWTTQGPSSWKMGPP